MKLYPESEVRKMLLKLLDSSRIWLDDDLIESLTSIELPSNEEIENRANEYHFKLNQRFFTEGAKWVIEKIKQQEK